MKSNSTKTLGNYEHFVQYFEQNVRFFSNNEREPIGSKPCSSENIGLKDRSYI